MKQDNWNDNSIRYITLYKEQAIKMKDKQFQTILTIIKWVMYISLIVAFLYMSMGFYEKL